MFIACILTFLYTGPPLAPSAIITTDQICFSSYSFYPIKYYAVTITDIINSSKTVDSEIACLARSTDLFPKNCSPFHLSVIARNKVGSSNSSIWTIGILKISLDYAHVHY